MILSAKYIHFLNLYLALEFWNVASKCKLITYLTEVYFQ